MKPLTEEQLSKMVAPLIELGVKLQVTVGGRVVLNNPNHVLQLANALYAASVNLAATVTDDRFEGLRKTETVEGTFPLKVCYFSDAALIAEAKDRNLSDTWDNQPGGRGILIRAIIEHHKKKIPEFGP